MSLAEKILALLNANPNLDSVSKWQEISPTNQDFKLPLLIFSVNLVDTLTELGGEAWGREYECVLRLYHSDLSKIPGLVNEIDATLYGEKDDGYAYGRTTSGDPDFNEDVDAYFIDLQVDIDFIG